MKKANRIAEFMGTLGGGTASPPDPCYRAYFQCFNEQRYYEAHDVLEHLWLKTRGREHLFYKALIQIAGAFVHLKKQFLRPAHRVDGARLRPAVRLFQMGLRNLEGYRPHHAHLNVEALCQLCGKYIGEISSSDFTRNPWHPTHAPKISIEE